MAKKSRLGDEENVAGPFQVPDSMFDDPDPPAQDAAFSDEDVAKIMGEEEQKWVTEGEPEPSWVTEGEPELAPPEAPAPAPPPPPHDGNWVSEGPPEVGASETWIAEPQTPPPGPEANLYQDVSVAPAADLPPTAPAKETHQPTPPPKKPAADDDFAGLVMHVGDDHEEEDIFANKITVEQVQTSAMTWLALAIGGTMVGVVGALVLVLVFTNVMGTGEPAAPSVVPKAVPEPGSIQVRKGLNAPQPTEPKVTNPEEEDTDAPDEGEAEEPVDDAAPPPPTPD